MAEERVPIYRNGIFCLEGDWGLDLKNVTSIEPVLKLLSDSHVARIPYIHRDIGTAGEFKYYLEKWTQSRYAKYPILYLGFHGKDGQIIMSDKRMAGSKVGLEDLEEWLKGKCRRRVIYFGSCETVTCSLARLQKFLKKINGLAVFGYRRTVDWIESTAMETIILGELQFNAMTRAGMNAVKRRVTGLLKGSRLYRDTGFRMIIRDK